MELGVTWNIFFVILGFIVGVVRSVPIDLESLKNGIQMGAIGAAGIAMDTFENVKGNGNFDAIMSFDPLTMLNKFNPISDSSDERKRKRRSAIEEKLIRPKRSPCLGRRRAQQTTTTTTAAPAVTPAPNPDDLRRRKRSSDYEMDIDENVIPVQKTIGERSLEFGERFRQLIKSMLDSLASAFEKLRMNIQNGMNNSSDIQ